MGTSTTTGDTGTPPVGTANEPAATNPASPTNKTRTKDKDVSSNKRRCVSTACIACRRRKSKCDGNLPKCAACASVYLTECEYAPHTDHRRKGVYKKDVHNLKTKNSTLHVLVQAILNAEEDEDAFDLVRQIRACDNLEDLALSIERKPHTAVDLPDSPIHDFEVDGIPRFEAELSSRMGDLVIDGSVRFIGGTSNLIWLDDSTDPASALSPANDGPVAVKPNAETVLKWTTVTQDKDLILHFMNMYFCWHYAYFTTLSKELFYRDFLAGTDSSYCSRLLVNVMLALGCHFSSKPAARANPDDSSTTGDHFFAEARRLLLEDDAFGIPRLCTVQALALMSVREAGCGRESKGWIYSGMSFRLASDLGLNIDADLIKDSRKFSDEEIDARRITFWGCFLFDKCWSNYLGRQPQLVSSSSNVQKPEVYGAEDSEQWSPYTDSGVVHIHTQPARTRAVSHQIFRLAEISSDLLTSFYQLQPGEKHTSKQIELKKLSDIHTRLEAWKKELSPEMEVKDGQLPQILLMHMFYQLLYIHLYRPFLRYTTATSPLPKHISPRKFCTQAASAISKLFRLYKRTHGLRQICNIAVYIAHSACTIHLLNLPDKNANRDIVHGIKHLEEVGDLWICARRTLHILSLCAEKWKVELPDEAQVVLQRTKQKWANFGLSSAPTSPAPLSPATQRLKSSLMPQDFTSDTREVIDVRQTVPASTDYQQSLHPDHDHDLDESLKHEQHVRHLSASDMVYGSPSMASNHYTDHASPMLHGLEHQQHPSSNMVVLQDDSPSHNLARSRLSLELTQAQANAWHAYQTKMGHLAGKVNRPSKEQQSNAAVLFGGVDSLIEESQDWWYNDQSQIALGFDNWNTPSSTDWSFSNEPNNLELGTTQTAAVHGGNSFLSNASPIRNGINHVGPPAPSGVSGFSLPARATHSHSQPPQHVQHHQAQRGEFQSYEPQMGGQVHPLVGQPTAMPMSYKRTNSFDVDGNDDLMYR